MAILQQLPGAYLRAVLSKRVRGEAEAVAPEVPEVALPVFQARGRGMRWVGITFW